MRIFISHSTLKDDKAGLARLTDLHAALEGPVTQRTGHDVLLDFKRLDASVEWRGEIDEWLAQCHAGVLMLTPKALQSSWVQKEATILAHRVARDPDFRLFPVLLDGVKPENLVEKGGHFAPLYLEAIQRVGATDPDGIAAAVIKELAKFELAPTTPLEALANDIAGLIRAGNNAALERICCRVTGQAVEWSAAETRADRCAREIARAIVRSEIGGYASAGALIQDLLSTPLTKEYATRALNLAAPLWVEGRAAAPIADFAKRNLDAELKAAPTARWVVALNGEQVPQFTAGMYLRRAYLPDQPPVVCSIEGGHSEDIAGEYIGRIRDEVRASLEMNGKSDESIDRFLAALNQPFFIVLPPPIPDAETLQILVNKYSKVTYIAQSGEKMAPPDELPPHVFPLDPPVDLDREIRAFQDFKLTRRKIIEA